MLKLQFKDNRKAPIWLTDEHFSIGQDDRNSLPLKHKSISAHHAEIGREADVFYISDMGSLTGTFVNGKRVNKRFQLRAGDTIKIGDVEFELTDPAQGSSDGAGRSMPMADWCVQAMSGSLKGKTFPILNAITIGRSSSCEIHISQEKVSRKHAELIVKGPQLILRDLGSSNGTIVNQKKISEVALTPGDQFHINNNNFLVIGPKSTEGSENEEEPTIFGAATIVAPPPNVSARNQATSGSPKSHQKPKIQRPNLDSLKSSNDRVSLNATSKGPSYIPAVILGVIALSALAAVAFIMQ